MFPTTPYYPSGGDSSSIFSSFSNIYQFVKDYWYIGAIVSGVIITGGGIFYFWEPISAGTLYSISYVKQSFNDVVQYFTTRAPDGGGDGGDNSSIEIVDFTPQNPDTSPTIENFRNRIENLANRLPSPPYSINF